MAVQPPAAGPFLTRYIAGEHESVWNELRALGDDVRAPAVYDEAWAVACETMRRARRNVTLIIRRLDRLGYVFWDGVQGSRSPQGLSMAVGGGVAPFSSAGAMAMQALSVDASRIPGGMRRHVEDLQSQLGSLLVQYSRMRADHAGRETARTERAEVASHLKDPNVFAPAGDDDRAWLAELDAKGMRLPLSVRAWFEIVGEVNLAGSHPRLCFWEGPEFPGVYADPFMASLDHFRFAVESWLEEHDKGEDPEPIEAVLGLSPEIKAGLAVTKTTLDQGYTLELPDAGADGVLVYAGARLPFVDYLRRVFRWGGFPGWADQDRRPSGQLLTLTDNLSPL